MNRLTICAALAAAAGAAIAQDLRVDVDIAGKAPIDRLGKAALEANPNLDVIPGSLLVTYREATGNIERDASRIVADTRAMRSFNISKRVEHLVVSDVDTAIAFLETLPWVESVEPDHVLRPMSSNDTFVGLQWGLNNTGQDIRGVNGTPDVDIDAFEAWSTTTGDPNLVIAVIDSGVQWSHPDLDSNIWSNPGEIAGNGIDDDGNGYVDDIRGWDFYDNDNDPDDADGHGTHVAGTIAAESNNSQGTAGVVWQAQIMPLRFIGPFGGSTSDAIAAIDYAVAAGCKLSNNSWGGGGFNSALQNAISSADAAGHLFVAAAGNDGRNTDSQPAYPASYNNDNIISVANITNTGALSGTSNYGANTVDIGAPGTDIASLYSGSSYVWLSGTSMASPHVAGVAAMLWSVDSGLTHDEVKAAILSSATPLASMNGLSTTGGFLNAVEALAAAGGGGGDDGGGDTGGGDDGGDPPPSDGPPAAPSGFDAVDLGNATVGVSWNDNSDNEDSFEIEIQRRQGRSYQPFGTVTAGADSTGGSIDLGQGGRYRLRIRAVNEDGASSWTGWDQVRVR